jgi:ComF family protein
MRLPTIGRAALELAGAILSPPRCAACAVRIAARRVFCPPCAASLERAEAPDAPFVYGGALARAITRFKYVPEPALARPLADLLRRGAPLVRAFAPDLLVPVPLHPLRLAERGFNQAALLAAPLAREIGAALAPRALARTRDTPRQAALERSARLANMRRAFAVTGRARVAGARVVLVDDVKTTGATLRACEEALREGGAMCVCTLVLAVSA